MSTLVLPEVARASGPAHKSHRQKALLFLCVLWVVIFFVSLFTPPVLDDADATHANAARQMALSGDYVTLRVNDVRYLEKAPLPYWIAAASIRIFGVNAFAVHLPQAVAVLLLMLLGYHWAREAYGERAALYTGLGVLTSAGVFLFTRAFIPDILLSLLLAASLYCFLKLIANPAYDPGPRPRTVGRDASHLPAFYQEIGNRSSAGYAYGMWVLLAFAVLTKGLVAPVFFLGATLPYLALTGKYRNWRDLKPLSGIGLFVAIAAPWHILAGFRNTGGANGHGFFWFYFINEHVLRFLGRRIPRDYNKLPGYLYWSLHLVWLFPSSLFAPAAFTQFQSRWHQLRREDIVSTRHSEGGEGRRYRRIRASVSNWLTSLQPTTLLVGMFAAFVLLFFSLSTNQEYYTFPAYLPLLMLTAAALARTEDLDPSLPASSNYKTAPTLTFAHAAFTTIGLAITAALSYGLWVSRHLAAVPDVGDYIAHRGVGDYTLSMSSLFDLTGPSFAALRLPATLALLAFAFGPGMAWVLRTRRRHIASTITVALTSALFLVAAHLAFARFASMMSSENFAAEIEHLETNHEIGPDPQVLLYGDQAYGASIGYYLNRPLSNPILLVDGRTSSMWFGSTFPDAQRYFMTHDQLAAEWGTGRRKILFVPVNHRDEVERLLGARAIPLAESSGKLLLTDRPLDGVLAQN